MKNSWSFVTVFPNLSETYSFETPFALIVPSDDNRVIEIRKKFRPIDNLLDSFIDTNLNKIKPHVLLLHNKIYSVKKNRHSAIVAFRNIVAISVILDSWIPIMHNKHNNIFSTLFSDYYEFFPLGGYGEKAYFVNSPALNSVVANAKIKYQSSFYLPESSRFNLFVDIRFFNNLMKIWENVFYYKKNDHIYSSIFRSLQLAFSALKMPLDNFSTIYDYGTKIGLWISAFEILFHPGQGKIGYKDIIKELNKYVLENKNLKTKKYVIDGINTNLLGLIYKDIYDVRNDFYHGNIIENNRLHIFKEKKFPIITHVAPILFLVALHVFLNTKVKVDKFIPKSIDERIASQIQKESIEHVFIKIAKKKIVTKYAT